jgi:TRAP-type C4-dicarboxylate transport system substrate-binding protein
MFTRRTFYLLIVVALLVTTSCSPQAAATPAATSQPITLRLAVSDEDDSAPSGPYVLEFVEQVNTLSNGNITIESVWGAGDSTEVGFERGVIQLVREGKFDLGLAASRAFDNDKDGITSFQALQAPFLIDNDALVVAVATNEVATKMLDNLSSSAGLAGLTLWPEDLRHPFSVDPAKPILSPEDFAGLNVRTMDTGVSEMLIKALGGTPMFEASDYQGAESGLLQGSTLTGRPAATGNVTFFPKYQVLFANSAAFMKLSDEQRAVLREAAAATQKKALAEHLGDAAARTAWCEDGGTIVLASDEQVAAFQKAAQPVFDKLQKDPFNAESIATIRALKAKTKSSSGAQACASTITVQTQASAENQTWSLGLPPNGTWTVELSNADLVRMGVLESNAKNYSGQQTYEFQDGEGIFRRRVNNVEVEICPFTYKEVENFVLLNFHDTGLGHYDCGIDHDEIQWRLDTDGLHFHLVYTTASKVEITAIYEAKPWQKVANP